MIFIRQSIFNFLAAIIIFIMYENSISATHVVEIAIRDGYVLDDLSECHIVFSHIRKDNIIQREEMSIKPSEMRKKIYFYNFQGKDKIKIDYCIEPLGVRYISHGDRIKILNAWSRSEEIRDGFTYDLKKMCASFSSHSMQTLVIPNVNIGVWPEETSGEEQQIRTSLVFDLNKEQNVITVDDNNIFFDDI